jgi:hypothetical protein
MMLSSTEEDLPFRIGNMDSLRSLHSKRIGRSTPNRSFCGHCELVQLDNLFFFSYAGCVLPRPLSGVACTVYLFFSFSI